MFGHVPKAIESAIDLHAAASRLNRTAVLHPMCEKRACKLAIDVVVLYHVMPGMGVSLFNVYILGIPCLPQLSSRM